MHTASEVLRFIHESYTRYPRFAMPVSVNTASFIPDGIKAVLLGMLRILEDALGDCGAERGAVQRMEARNVECIGIRKQALPGCKYGQTILRQRQR
jgi:hypothetical protein